MYLNRVELIGFLGREPEATFTPNGKAVTSLSLATKTSWLKDDQRQERTEWHKIQLWGKLGEYGASFRKGAHIRVEGELRTREYENEAGAKVRTYVIVASSVTNLRPGQRTTAQDPESDPVTTLPPEADPM
jgi:single-strand DNA-binding protein